MKSARRLSMCLMALLFSCLVNIFCLSHSMAAENEPAVSSKQFGVMINIVENADQFHLLSGSQPSRARQ